MSIKKKQFGHHAKDTGDEWFFYLCIDTDQTHSRPFIVLESDIAGRRSEKRFEFHEYLTSGERGVGKLLDLISTLID